MKTILGFVVFLIFILTSSAVKAECIRCLNDGGSDLVCENDAVFDLIKKCGEPDRMVKTSDKTGGVFQSKTKKRAPT